MKNKETESKEPYVTGKVSLVARLEMTPLDVSAWQDLARRVKDKGDFLSVKTLHVIITGLKTLEEVSKKSVANHAPMPKLTAFATGQFSRLAKSYNSPKLLKEVGTIYLNELHLPTVALHHFERAQQLGSTEQELTMLIETAAVFSQKQIALEKGGAPTHSGISQAQHARPVAAEAIRKTSRILLPSTLRPPPGQTRAIFEPAQAIAETELPATTAECLEEAKKALDQSNLTRAHALLLKAGEKPENDEEMWRLWSDLGMAHYEADSYKGMEAAYEEAHRYGRHEVASYFNLALALHLNQEFERATAFYLTAERIEPNNPKVWCNLGVLYFQGEQYARAEAALRKAVEAKPDYVRGWDNLGSALGAQNNLEEALLACQKAIELKPGHPEAHFKMGVIHFGAGRQAEATESFRHALQLPVLKPFVYAFIGIMHARAERLEIAEASIRQATAVDPQCGLLWSAWNELGMACYLGKEYGKAIAAYEEAIHRKTDEPGIWFNLGLAFHAAGYHKKAQEFYQHALDLNVNFYDAWHNMGIVLAELGMHGNASMAFRAAVQLSPNSPRGWYDLAVSLELEGRTDEAKDAYERSDALAQVAV